jgi:phage baseplate assembly protein W
MAQVNARKTDFADLPLSLPIHPNKKDVPSLKDDEAIKQAVKNLILSNYGERPFNHRLAGNITGFLFENINPVIAQSIRQAIMDLLSVKEPRIQVQQIFVDPKPDDNRYDVTIAYKIVGIDITEEINFYLNRIR